MTSRERMLTALEHKKPDRLPVTIHQWQPYHLKTYMHGMSDIEANKACGLDASITVYEELPMVSGDWRVESRTEQKSGYYVTHYTIQTPEGILTTSEGTSPMTTWVIEHLIKREEDIHLLRKYRPVPKLNKKKVWETYDALGDGGILRTFICGKQGGCWQDACELFGVENMIFATYDDPDWVEEFLDILLKQKQEYIEENLRGLPFDLVETGGGAASNTVISHDIHERFCLPYDVRMHDMIHEVGFKTVYHTCGGMTRITDLLVQNHCDVSETLSPGGVGGDINSEEAARKLYGEMHPYVTLIGGMDQINLLEKGTKQQIEEEVRKLFECYGRDGGYIMSACDHFFTAPPENLKIFAQAAGNYKY